MELSTPRAQAWDEREGVVQSVTYEELAVRMLGAAAYLRDECGLVPSGRVALLAHNSIAYLALSLGTMCAGGAALHLNWRQPVGTTRALLAGLAPRVLCASAPFAAEAQTLGEQLDVRVVLLSEDGALPCPPRALSAAAEFNAATEAAGAAHATCAVFFTGGTTGTPKAVPHTHASLLHFADAQMRVEPRPTDAEADHAGTHACSA